MCGVADRSAVTQLGAELDGAWHEGSGPASDFLAAAVKQNAFGNIKAFRTADDMAAREELTI